MADYKNKDPNWVCTFSLKKNASKDPNKPETKNRPDFVLVDSTNEDGTPKMNKAGTPFKKNFTISGSWCEGSGYVQEDKSLKITIKKTGTTPTASAAPQQEQQASGFMDQF
tara:strand:- start:30 stop:362 length:333 start_codon:yes stop_codon:yes gene_type:complete